MRAPLEETFYNVDVTPEDMWKAVGTVLEETRLRKKWGPIDVERAGGPSYKTVQAIEKGNIGNVEKLGKCADALGLSVVDILYTVLAANTTALSADAAQLVRKFQQTTVEGRLAMLSVANAVPVVAGPSGTAPSPTDAAPLSKRRLPPSGLPAGKRRTDR